MKYEILLGADPEMFVQNTTTGEFVSAHNIIPGTKDDPYMVHYGAVQVDGVAAEFNIQPAHTREQFVGFIDTVRTRMQQMVSEFNPDYLLVAEPTAIFSREYFDSLPSEVLILGCTPDFNAYSMGKNKPPHTTEPFRTGGGHIHIGFGKAFDPSDKKHFMLCCEIVKQIDAILFPASFLWDSDEKRRTLYGNKGAFRPKSYGVEYRPLSNAWLRDQKTIEFVYDQVYGAVDLLLNKGVKVYD